MDKQESEESMDGKTTAIIIIGVILLSLALVETFFLVSSFIFADEISCNFLWCTFTTTRSETTVRSDVHIDKSIVSNSYCYRNDVPINCSELEVQK